jgi:hypothetical protein
MHECRLPSACSVACRTGRAQPSPTQADAIVTAAGSARSVTLVAQSMGAFSAPLTCERLPVAELVL